MQCRIEAAADLLHHRGGHAGSTLRNGLTLTLA
jgi:hypothetical protein